MLSILKTEAKWGQKKFSGGEFISSLFIFKPSLIHSQTPILWKMFDKAMAAGDSYEDKMMHLFGSRQLAAKFQVGQLKKLLTLNLSRRLL